MLHGPHVSTRARSFSGFEPMMCKQNSSIPRVSITHERSKSAEVARATSGGHPSVRYLRRFERSPCLQRTDATPKRRQVVSKTLGYRDASETDADSGEDQRSKIIARANRVCSPELAQSSVQRIGLDLKCGLGIAAAKIKHVG